MKNIDEIKRDPDVLLQQCVRYFNKVYGQVPREARTEWLAKLKEVVNKGLEKGAGMVLVAICLSVSQ